MADKNIVLSERDAYALKYLIDDILEVDNRANCSDRFFRTHFMNVVKAGIVNGTYANLSSALEGLTAEPEPAAEAPVSENVVPAKSKAAKK